jgi:glycine cleavage system aminomethyltransferase T
MNNTSAPLMTIGPRVRKSPFYNSTRHYGAKSFTVYNHTYMPTSYGDTVAEYWAIIEGVTLWDVTCEKQVEVTGPDAEKFVQLLTCRNISTCAVNRCRYVVFTDDQGGIVNDAVLLRLAENHFWLSPGDGDLLLWAQGVAAMAGMSVKVEEPDASPLQLQGPLSPQVAQKLFGNIAIDMGYFHMCQTELNGIPVVLSRTGWSGELGYEIYLRDGSRGDELWEIIMAAGAEHGITPACPPAVRTVEGFILSYASDISRSDNPYTIGMGRLVDLDMETDFIGKAALKKIAAEGPKSRLVGVELDGEEIRGNEDFWDISHGGEKVGHITRAAYSPRIKKNIGLANIATELTGIGTVVTVSSPQGERRATVVATPWIKSETVIPAR